MNSDSCMCVNPTPRVRNQRECELCEKPILPPPISLTGPNGERLERTGKILACNKCADVASDQLIKDVLKTKDGSLLAHSCGGRFALMAKIKAASIAISWLFSGEAVKTVDQEMAELSLAGWQRVKSTIWKSPGGGLYRGPHGAYKAMAGMRDKTL